MHAVKRKITVGMPILGLTSDKGKERVVAAVYFDPGFMIYDVIKAPNFRSMLRPAVYIGSDLSIGDAQDGYPVPLFPRPSSAHSYPRAQLAQIDPEDNNRLLYIQNGARSIGSIRLDDLGSENNSPQFHGQTKKRMEYFTRLSTGEIVTIEDFSSADLAIYRHDHDGLIELRRVPLKSFEAMRNAMKVQGEGISFIYGLAQLGVELLMVTDARSNIKKGVYSLDLSAGIEKAMQDSDAMTRKEGLSGIVGNGIAPVKGGIITSVYRFERRRQDLGRPSTLSYHRL